MSGDTKLSKAQLSKTIESGGSFSYWLRNLRKKGLTNVAIPFGRDNMTGLVSNLASNTVYKCERKESEKGAVRARKGFTLFILNEDMNEIIKIIKSLENLGILIDGVTEKQEDMK